MNHVLSKIYTAHYRYGGPDRVDITVKGQDPRWKEFAPTWNMVMGVKKGTMSEAEYIRLYLIILSRVSTTTWDALLQMEEVTFVCFCNKDWFCHRNILVRYIVESLGDRVSYMGWREVPKKE
jgi:hypothetical protein